MLIRVLKGIPLLAMALCAATVVAQSVGVGVLWSRGALTQDKIRRYAAVIYGFDPRDFPSPDHREGTGKPSSSPTNPTTALATRVEKHPLLDLRIGALEKETYNVQEQVRELTNRRERYETVRKSFEVLLDKLEQDASLSATQEVQGTLEVLQPRQAKDLIQRMLDEGSPDEREQVRQEVVAIVKSMPQERLKKIFAEFRTSEERQMLHEIMVRIGELPPRVVEGPDS